MWVYRVVLAALLLISANAAAAQERLALVIGVDTYQAATIPDLQRARNDAIAVGAALSEIGFSVTQLLDPTRLEMTRALIELEGRIRDGDEVAFFFAGHGVEVAGENFLLPADMPVVLAGQQGLVQAHGISVDFVRTRIQEGGARVRFLILDACRENPFPSRSGLGGGGLANIRNSVEGEFILYSAGAEQVALDGLSVEDPNPNSVFTRTLLPLLREPGLPLHEMARQVRRDVRNLAATVGAYQRPAIHDDIDTNYALVPVAEREPALEELWPLQPPPPQAQRDPACDAARPDWERAVASGDIAQFRAFAAAHPDCALYAGLAATMLDLLAAQAAAVESSEGLEDILALREQEVAALRQQLGEVTRILDSTAEADAARDAQIDRLGAELNAALARAALAERQLHEDFNPEQASAISDRLLRDELAAESNTDEQWDQLPSELVFRFQQELNRIGCEPGPIDGVWGENSVAALRRYQQVAGTVSQLPPTSDLLRDLEQLGPLACHAICEAGQTMTTSGCVSDAPSALPSEPTTTCVMFDGEQRCG